MREIRNKSFWRGLFATPTLAAVALFATSCSNAPTETTTAETSPAPEQTVAQTSDAPSGAEQPGSTAPDFTLVDTDGKERSLDDYRGKYVVLEWLNHGCPFVKKHYEGNNMQELQKEATANDVVWLSIVSSKPDSQGHYEPAQHNKMAQEKGAAGTAILIDEDGKVGRLYDAKTTPHMFVIDPEGVILYNGAIDDKPSTDKESLEGATNYVRVALDEARAGKPVTTARTQPYGCAVKY